MRWRLPACSPSTVCPESWSPTGRPAVRGAAGLAGGAFHRAALCARRSVAGRCARRIDGRPRGEKLGGKTVRDVLPEHLLDVPAANADDTIIEVAAMMVRLRSPLIAVIKDGKLHGVITASRLLAAALKH